MATKDKEPVLSIPSEPELLDIAQIKERLNVPDSIFQGMAAQEGWRTGKHVTIAEFEQAVKSFLGSPIRSRKQVPNA